MKKQFLLLMLLILLTGCTSKYHLNISNDSFKEYINIAIPSSEMPQQPTDLDEENDDPLTPFLNDKSFAFYDERNKFYKKIVKSTSDLTTVNMKYNYSAKDFGSSITLNKCFSDFSFENDKNYYIHAQGKFYCLYSDSMDIEIETKNKVIKNNADDVNGNVYIWHINTSNEENINIEFEVNKGFPTKKTISYLFIILIGGILLFLIYFYFDKKKKKVNKI